MKLDADSLEALEAIADQGTIAKASAALNKTQSAVSYHLRRLEERLGLRLLDRSGYRLQLTADGKAVLREARPLLSGLRDLSAFASRGLEGWETELKVFFDGALPASVILEALKELEQQSAPTNIDLRVEFLDGVQAAFARHNGDIMIAAIVEPQPDLAMRTLAPFGLTLCCAADHALARLAIVSHDELRGHVELIVPNAQDGAALAANQFQSRRVFRLCDFHTKLEAIRHGIGFGWLPDYLARKHIDLGELCPVPIVTGYTHQLLPVVANWSSKPMGNAARYIVDYVVQRGWEKVDRN